MKLRLDTSKFKFMVGADESQAKTDQSGNQRHDRATNAPLWVTDVIAMDQVPNAQGKKETHTIKVTTAGEKPKVSPMEAVSLVELEAMHWSMDKNSGVSYRAKAIEPLQAPVKAAKSA